GRGHLPDEAGVVDHRGRAGEEVAQGAAALEDEGAAGVVVPHGVAGEIDGVTVRDRDGPVVNDQPAEHGEEAAAEAGRTVEDGVPGPAQTAARPGEAGVDGDGARAGQGAAQRQVLDVEEGVGGDGAAVDGQVLDTGGAGDGQGVEGADLDRAGAR